MAFLELFTPFSTPLHQVSASFRPGVTLKGGGGLGHLSLILLTFTAALSLLPVPGNGARHRCYVCLPDDKTSTPAKDIQLLFPGKTIPDCSKFPNVTDDSVQIAHEYEFDCPNDYTGCSLRYTVTDSPTGIHGARTCTPRHSRNCYTVNSIVLCYCAQPLCNRDKATSQLSADLPLERDPIRTSRYFSQGLTDDEELLPAMGGPRPSFHRQRPTTEAQGRQTQAADDEEGSGHFADDSEEYDDDEDELVKPIQTSAEHNVSHSHEPNGDHLITISIPTGNNETHSVENDNEPHHPSHNNDPTHPDHSNIEVDNRESSKENVNGSLSEDEEIEQERDAPTILQSGADGGHHLSNILLLLISSLVYLVSTKRS